MRDFAYRWKGTLGSIAATIGFVAAFFIGTAYEGTRRPFVPAPEVNVKALNLPGQVVAPAGHLASIKADSPNQVAWIVPPEYASKMDSVPIGNTLLFVPLTTNQFSIAAVSIDQGTLVGPVWCTILSNGTPTPTPPPPPPPGPTPTPIPSAKVKAWVIVVYDQAKLTDPQAALLRDTSLRTTIAARGHVLRILESSSATVSSLKLAPWVAKAGGPPALLIQSAEGSSKGSVLSSVALPADASSVLKAVTDAGGN